MIKGPKNAIPTTKGWVHPKTNELLKSQRITQAQIDEWYGANEPAPKIEEIQDVVYSSPEPEVVEEATEEAEEEGADIIYSAPKKKKSGLSRMAKAIKTAKDKITNN